MDILAQQINDLFSAIPDKVAEFQIDSNGLIEQGYFVDDINDLRIKKLLNFLILKIPKFNDFLDFGLEVLSFHPADGLAYKNPTLVGNYSKRFSSEIAKLFSIPTENKFAEGFVIKYDLVDNSLLMKINDLDFDKYNHPKLPLFSLASKKLNYLFRDKIGVGVHFSTIPDDPRCEYIDFYFVNPFRFIVQHFFGDKYPKFKEDFFVFLRAYGVTVRNGSIIKMKRYIYWNDKAFIRFYKV